MTAEGRRYFKRKEGAKLKPGVTGKADTAEKMKRKGSFLTRFYSRSKLSPLVSKTGNPTRFALAAHAWGEPVPKTQAAARKLAKKGEALLARYERSHEKSKAKPKKSTAKRGR